MFDCSREIRAFHDEKVRLSEPYRINCCGHRDANRERATNGLKLPWPDAD